MLQLQEARPFCSFTHASFRLSITLSIPDEDRGELVVYTLAVTLEALRPLMVELGGRRKHKWHRPCTSSVRRGGCEGYGWACREGEMVSFHGRYLDGCL
jgi:hypothetical protein